MTFYFDKFFYMVFPKFLCSDRFLWIQTKHSEANNV